LHIFAVDKPSRLVKCVELIGWCYFNERVILCVAFSRNLRVVWDRKYGSHIYTYPAWKSFKVTEIMKLHMKLTVTIKRPYYNHRAVLERSRGIQLLPPKISFVT